MNSLELKVKGNRDWKKNGRAAAVNGCPYLGTSVQKSRQEFLESLEGILGTEIRRLRGAKGKGRRIRKSLPMATI